MRSCQSSYLPERSPIEMEKSKIGRGSKGSNLQSFHAVISGMSCDPEWIALQWWGIREIQGGRKGNLSFFVQSSPGQHFCNTPPLHSLFFCLATRLLFFVKRPNYFVSGQFADLFKKNFSFSLQFNSPDASVPRQTQILTPLPPSLGSKRSGGQTTGSRRGGGVNEGGGGGEEKEKEEEEEGVTEFKLVFFWDKEGGIFSQSLKNRPNWAPPPHFEANRLFPILHTYSVLPSRTWQC